MNIKNIEYLKEIVKNNALIKIKNIVENTDLQRDLGYDSIKVIQLVVDIESIFEFDFEDDELNIDLFSNYGELERFVKRKLEES